MKIYHFIKLAIFIVFSSLVFVFRKDLLMNLHYLVGSLILLYGAEETLVFTIVFKKAAYTKFWFVFGLIEAMIGIIVLCSIRDYTSVCVIWALWSILREAVEIYEITSGEVKGLAAVISAVESLVAITFSILLMVTPGEHHAKTHIYLLIIELIVTALVPVLRELAKNKKNSNENIE